jgi:uncharacterized protein involved in exopolysaccharide biosynthesis
VPAAAAAALTGADRRTAEKELSAIDRQLAKLGTRITSTHDELAAHDQSDYTGVGALNTRLQTLEAELAALEERWLEVGESLGH